MTPGMWFPGEFTISTLKQISYEKTYKQCGQFLLGVRLQLSFYVNIRQRLLTDSTAEMTLQDDLNQRGSTNLVPEFVVKIVSWETKRPVFSAVKLAGRDWDGKKSKDSQGEINKNRTPQGFEGDECNELREKLEGMSDIIKAIRKKK